MTEESSWYRQLEPEAASEADIIVREFREHGIEIGGVTDLADQDGDVTPNGVAFMYAKGQLLTREQYLGGLGGLRGAQRVQSASTQRGVLDIVQEHAVEDVEVRRIVSDIVLLRLNPNGAPEREQPDVLDVLDHIDEELGVGVATPDQVLTAANGSLSPCSATEPEEFYGPREPYPPVCPGDGGARVRIFIADTGLLPGAAETFPWLHGVEGGTDPRTGPGDTILPYEGHGTFVAGVLRCMAPGAQIHVANIFDIAGSALESDFVQRLNAAFGFGFEILHLTASCMTRKNIPLLALEAWLELLRPYQGVTCVAPAGNNHTRRPSWPAAFAEVISVGALAADRQNRAFFSDYGGWVDVYAPGQNLINAYASGTYTCQIPPFAGEQRTFSGLAQWSGTSFSAPIVTGLIAARMARRGESARDAAAALLAQARAESIPGVGPVLLPGCGDDDDRCERCGGRGFGRGHGHGCGHGHRHGCGHGGDGGHGHGGHCGCGGECG